MDEIAIEVVYATPEKQLLLGLNVPVGTTARRAVLLSNIQNHFPEINLESLNLGVFGKVLSNADAHVLQAGDRVEIYRPLLLDPKEVRKRRAEQAKARAASGE